MNEENMQKELTDAIERNGDCELSAQYAVSFAVLSLSIQVRRIADVLVKVGDTDSEQLASFFVDVVKRVDQLK